MDLATFTSSSISPDEFDGSGPRYAPKVIMGGILQQTSVQVLYIIFIILVLVINIFLVVVILLSKSMRTSSRHLLIINVCIGDIIMGLYVLPVLLNLGLRTAADGQPSCDTLQSLRIFAEFLIPSVATLAVLALNIDYILRLYCSMYSEGISRILIIVALFATPWLSSFFILIPLYKDNLLSDPYTECSIKADEDTEKTLLLLSFFPQAFLVLIFNAVVSVLYLINRESYGLDAQGERIRAPQDICLASFATLVLYAPVFLISLITTQNLGCEEKGECYALNDLYTVAIWAMMTKSWLMCFSWFTCRDTRLSIREVLRF